MRHTVPRTSYYVRDRNFDLPKLLPTSQKSLDRWILHYLRTHDFVQCQNFEIGDDMNKMISTGDDRYVIMFRLFYSNGETGHNYAFLF